MLLAEVLTVFLQVYCALLVLDALSSRWARREIT